MEDYITRPEFVQYEQRMAEENQRQNKRLSIVEDSVTEIKDLTISVNKLADSMERMLGEQKELGVRLQNIEEAPVRNWNTIKVAILTAIGTAVGTAIVAWAISIL